MNPGTINWLAVVVAALSAFMVGGLWYSPVLLGKAWLASANLTTEEIKAKANNAKIFGMTAVFSVIMAIDLAFFINDPKTDWKWGAIAGGLAGLWTFSAIAIHSLFELKSWKYIFINGFYTVVSLVIMGAIIGAWR